MASAASDQAGDDARTIAEGDAPPAPAADITATTLVMPIGDLIRARLRRGEEGGRLGRYHILRLLGEGGMGLVFAAYDDDLDRKVAIKLLRADGPGGPLDAAWLLSEAKAMARISHPNVVQIYDVGEYEGQVFVAMELVDGVSLRDWLRQQSRTIPEIVRAFAEAGRGLQAVHDAGLIHRDFKPQNVLVSAHGRVRVLDFGLAHRRPTPDPAQPLTGSHRALSSASTPAPAATAGTPAYMAPEQHLGLPIDARADVFAFSVALYEALFGRRPFAAKNRRDLVAAITQGAIDPPPPESRVPLWVHKHVVRGLAADPAARWPSMAAMVDALERDPWKIRLRVLAALAVLAALTATLALALHYRALAADREARACAGGEARLVGVWDDDRRHAAEAAFIATGRPFAASTWSKVQIRLAAFADAWVAAHRSICEEHRRGELPTSLHDKAVVCLDAARRDLDGLARVLVDADATAVEKAIKATEALPPIARCADRSALAAQVLPPADPAVAAEVDAIRGELAAIRADLLLTHTDRCRELDGHLARADALAYRPLAAEIRFQRGRCDEIGGDYEHAVADMRQAALGGLSVGHDVVALEATTRLAYVLAYRLARTGEARGFIDLADALIERSDASVDSRARALINRGALLIAEGAPRESIAPFDAAIALLEAHPLTTDLGVALNNRAAAYSILGEHERVVADFTRAYEIYRDLLGEDHPDAASFLTNIGNARTGLGDLDGAQAAHQEALALKESLLGPDHPDVAMVLVNLGNVHAARRDRASARAVYERALSIRERALGPDHPATATVLANLGELHSEDGRPADAEPLLRRALAARERAEGRDHHVVASILVRLGRAELGTGRPREARAHLERAAAIFERASTSADERDYLDIYLAQARWATARTAKDRAAARAIAEAVVARGTNSRLASETAELTAWLALRAR